MKNDIISIYLRYLKQLFKQYSLTQWVASIITLFLCIGIGLKLVEYIPLEKTKRLANAGDASAQCNLGWMYMEGEGVPQDYKEAVKWYRLSADQGDADAQYNLGVMYDQSQILQKQ